MHPRERIIVALDNMSAVDAKGLIGELQGRAGYVKVGLDLITQQAAGVVAEHAHCHGMKVFWDGKWDDIPNTVQLAANAGSAWSAVGMVNIHCSAGRAAMEATAKAIATARPENRPLVLGVTVLTSKGYNDLVETGELTPEPWHNDAESQQREIEKLVVRRALLAQACGLDGVICSPKEIVVVRQACGPEFVITTPGIRRAANAPPDDQKRTLTAREAVSLGADYLVIGRPITQSSDMSRAEAAESFVQEVYAAQLEA